MEPTAEIPDAHVADLAKQFLDAAVLLRQHIRVAPTAMQVNAAFAIELFIKSLSSHWKCHRLDELVVDDDEVATDLKNDLDAGATYEVTTESNVRGHRLSDLFAKLPDNIRQSLSAEFGSHKLAQEHKSLEAILDLYSCTFELERYGFEQRVIETRSRPIKEIVALGEFFADFVKRIERVRTWEPDQGQFPTVDE